MKTLADAWDWYRSTRLSLEQIQRIGRKYWDEIPWETAAIGRDDDSRMVEAEDIEVATKASLAPIDDLAVVVLFSVFESLVRIFLVGLIKPEAVELSNPILKEAADDAIRGVEEGSFYRRVLEPLKQQERVPADLVTQVDQVRDYRNWVAHGRRDTPTNNITPSAAFARLGAFLDALGIAVEAEHVEPAEPGEEHE
jgi:hypothetical protein